MALPKPEQILGTQKSSLPTPDEVLGVKKKEPTEQQTSFVGSFLKGVESGLQESTTQSGSEAQSTSTSTSPFDVRGQAEEVTGLDYTKHSPFDVKKRAGQTVVNILTDVANNGEALAYERPNYRVYSPQQKGADANEYFYDDFAEAAPMDYWIQHDMAADNQGLKGENSAFFPTKFATIRNNTYNNLVLPLPATKALDDYMKYLSRKNPNKYMEYLAKDGKMSMTLSDDSPEVKRQKQSIEEQNLVIEALNHERNLIESEYYRLSEGGKKNPVDASGMSLKEKYNASMLAIAKAQQQYVEQNPGVKERIDKEMAAQRKALANQLYNDWKYEQAVKDNGQFAASLEYGIIRPIGSSLYEAAADIVSTPATLGRTVGVSDFNKFAEWADDNIRVADWKPSHMKMSIFDRDGFNFDNVVGSTTGMITDMATLLAGSKGVAGVTRLGYKPSLVATAYLTQYDNYYKDAVAGLNAQGIYGATADREADSYARKAAATTAALELVAPNLGITGQASQRFTKSYLANVAKGQTKRLAFKNAASVTLKEVGQEVTQETLQLLGDKVNNKLANQRAGIDFLEDEITLKEVGETVFYTSLVTGGMMMSQLKRPNTMQKSVLYAAARDYDNFKTSLDDLVKTATITKEQAKVINSSVEDLKKAVDGLPANIKMNDRQKAELAFAIAEKNRVVKEATQATVDPMFAEQKEKEVARKVEALDKEIQATMEDAKKEANISAMEGREAQKEYQDVVSEYASTMDKEAFVDRMMEEDYEGEIEEKQARKYYSKLYDKANQQRVSGDLGKGEELEQTEFDQGSSGETAEAGSLLEKGEKVTVNPEIFSIFEEQGKAKSGLKKESLDTQLNEIATPEDIEDARLVQDNFDDIVKQMTDNGDVIQDCEI